jgi:hypothetical protein
VSAAPVAMATVASARFLLNIIVLSAERRRLGARERPLSVCAVRAAPRSGKRLPATVLRGETFRKKLGGTDSDP